MTRILVACDASWNHRTRQGSIAAILFNEQQQQIVTQAIHITTHDPIDVFELEQLAAVLGVYTAVQIGKTQLDIFYDNHLVEPKAMHKKTTVKAQINQQYQHEISAFKQQKIKLKFHKIKVHTTVEHGGNLLNKAVDQLATLAAHPQNCYPKLALKLGDVSAFFGQVMRNHDVNVTIVTYLLKQHPFFSRFRTIVIDKEVIDLRHGEHSYNFNTDYDVAQVAQIFLATEKKHGTPPNPQTLQLLEHLRRQETTLASVCELLKVTVQFPKQAGKKQRRNQISGNNELIFELVSYDEQGNFTLITRCERIGAIQATLLATGIFEEATLADQMIRQAVRNQRCFVRSGLVEYRLYCKQKNEQL